MRDSSDRVVAVSAGLIGMAALAISAYQAYIMREQQRTSVWPRVELLVTNSQSGFSVTMSNAGIGPALIAWAEVTVDGQPKRTWAEVMGELGTTGPFSQGKIADRVLAPNLVQEIWAPNDPPAIALVNQGAERVRLRVCYCSIYDECWTVSRTLRGGSRLVHEEVRRCRIDEARRFGQ